MRAERKSVPVGWARVGIIAARRDQIAFVNKLFRIVGEMAMTLIIAPGNIRRRHHGCRKSLAVLHFGMQARMNFLPGRTSVHIRCRLRRWLRIFAWGRHWSGFVRKYRELLPLPSVDQQGKAASVTGGLGFLWAKMEYQLHPVELRIRTRKSPTRLHGAVGRRSRYRPRLGLYS